MHPVLLAQHSEGSSYGSLSFLAPVVDSCVDYVYASIKHKVLHCVVDIKVCQIVSHSQI